MKPKEGDKRKVFKLPRNMTLVWAKGFLNGRTGTAALSDDQIVQSGYVQMLQKRYEAFCAEQIRRMDIEFHALSAEAEKLLGELRSLREPLPDGVPVREEATVIEQRAAERRNAELKCQRERCRLRQKEVLDRLVDIRSTFSELDVACRELLLKTASETETVLASYCKGVMYRRPITKSNIPRMEISDTLRLLHENIEWTRLAIFHIDEEVNKSYENISEYEEKKTGKEVEAGIETNPY